MLIFNPCAMAIIFAFSVQFQHSSYSFLALANDKGKNAVIFFLIYTW